MIWFLETPWPPILICLAGAALLLLGWRQNRKRALLWAAVALLLACPAIYVVERLVVTGPEEVEERLQELARAVEAGDVDRTLAFFGEEQDGVDETERSRLSAARTAVSLGMTQVRVRGPIRISDVHARFNEDRSAVLCDFRAAADVEVTQTGYRGRLPTRWELTWRKVGGQWRITNLRRLDPMTDKEIDILAHE